MRLYQVEYLVIVNVTQQLVRRVLKDRVYITVQL